MGLSQPRIPQWDSVTSEPALFPLSVTGWAGGLQGVPPQTQQAEGPFPLSSLGLPAALPFLCVPALSWDSSRAPLMTPHARHVGRRAPGAPEPVGQSLQRMNVFHGGIF